MKRCSAAASTRCPDARTQPSGNQDLYGESEIRDIFLALIPAPDSSIRGQAPAGIHGFENKWIPARAPHLPTEAGLAGMAAIHATNLRHTTTSARSRYKPTGVALPAGHCRNSITRPHSRPFRLPTNNERAAVCRDCAARSQGPRRSAPQRDGFPRRLRARTAAAPRPTRRT